MTTPRPGDRARPFRADELDGVSGIRPDELAAESRLARDLEGIAARGGVAPSPGFADRVMAAVALEPVPAPVIAAGSALRHGAALGFLTSIRDALRVTFGGGFPLVVRAQSLALVLIVAAVAGGSGLATAGAFGLLGDRGSPSPVPSMVAPSPTPTATPLPTDTPDATIPSMTPSPTPSGSPEPTASDEPETASPEETGDAEAERGSGSGDARTADPTADPTEGPTPSPTPTPTPGHTEEPHEIRTPGPTDTPKPTTSASPSPTPLPTDEH